MGGIRKAPRSCKRQPLNGPLLGGFVALTLALSLPAKAQADAVASPNGIKLGEARLHPFLDLQLRYDSAAGFFASDPALPGFQSGDFLVHVKPGLKLQLQSDDTSIDFSGSVGYVFYSGLLQPTSTGASHVQADASLSAAFNRTGSVEFQVIDHLVRSDRTTTPIVAVGVLSLFNELRLAAPIHPGGRAFEITPSAAWSTELFQAFSQSATVGCDPSQPGCTVTALNYTNLNANLIGRWRFLPKTAVVADVNFDNRTYHVGTPPPTMLLRATGGLSGLVSTKIALVLKAGYASDFSNSGGRGLLAQAEGTYYLTETTTFRLGYQRTVQPVPVLGTFADDRGYFEARSQLAGRLNLHAAVAYDYIAYFGNSGRVDQNLTLDVGPEYQFSSWFTASLAYAMGNRTSNNPSVGANFTRHEVIARASFTY
jgi:hypothetical protein